MAPERDLSPSPLPDAERGSQKSAVWEGGAHAGLLYQTAGKTPSYQRAR